MDPRFLTYNSGPLWLLVIIIITMFYKSCMHALSAEEVDEDQLFEGLKDYQEALKDDDKSIIIGEEEYYKRKYNVQSVSSEQIQRIKASETADYISGIQGVATYRMLDNLEYQ